MEVPVEVLSADEWVDYVFKTLVNANSIFSSFELERSKTDAGVTVLDIDRLGLDLATLLSPSPFSATYRVTNVLCITV